MTPDPIHDWAAEDHAGNGLEDVKVADLAPRYRREPRWRRLVSRLVVALTGKVWVVGRVQGTGIAGILGAYATAREAEARCCTAFDIMGPLELGVSLPETSDAWKGHRYPIKERLQVAAALRRLDEIARENLAKN